MGRVLGEVTRGTTGANRLRRVDRWLAHRAGPLLRAASAPTVVDLGFGSSPVTTIELADRLRAVAPAVEVVGLDVDAGRVAAAGAASRPGLRFAVGGFELAGMHPHVVRAANVLRQYAEADVAPAWAEMISRLAPGGFAVDVTCDELGRRAAWVVLDGRGPVSLVVSCRLASVERPSDVAERLPKALIHHNIAGEPVHEFLTALDRAWERAASLTAFGRRQRWEAAVGALRDLGWPVRGPVRRWRLGEVEVAWEAVAPRLGGERGRDVDLPPRRA